MIHRVLVYLLSATGGLWLVACTPPAASGEAVESSASDKKEETKPQADEASTAANPAPGYGGIRPPKELYNLPHDRELKATNPVTDPRPKPGGVIVNPPGPTKER